MLRLLTMCNAPDVTCHICNATLAIFGNVLGYFLCGWVSLRFAFWSCHAFLIMSSCASHSHTCSSHESELFPRCPFCNPALLCSPASPFTFLRERVLNILGMDLGLSGCLGITPVDRLSSFGSFGGRLILQRLTG